MVIPDVIQMVRPSNVRYDETSTNQFYSKFLFDSNQPINNLLVVNSAEKGSGVPITCYEVFNPTNVLSVIRTEGLSYDQFTYSIYGMIAPIPPEDQPPEYKFLFQEGYTSQAKWYITRAVLPSFDYLDESNTNIHLINEGITVNEIIDAINDYQNIPFI